MSTSYKDAQNPLILRCHRLMDAFARSDDERDFYLDRMEGFIIYADLDKSDEELRALEEELQKNADRYCAIPKLTFYETKKIMEGFVNEKVYDIDTKEKLLDIIQSKEAREHFLEFLYDHHSELEKWQQYYQERSRIRIIEWLRNHDFQFVFEEDLDLPKPVVEKLKSHLFETKVPKELLTVRKALFTKAETYYSNEALNPRPKRGRPPKQVAKVEVEPQFTQDLYMHVPSTVRPFLFVPDITSIASVTFSAKHDNEEEFLASLKNSKQPQNSKLDELTRKLATLRSLSSQVVERQIGSATTSPFASEETSRKAPTSVLEKPSTKKVSSFAFEDEEIHPVISKETLSSKSFGTKTSLKDTSVSAKEIPDKAPRAKSLPKPVPKTAKTQTPAKKTPAKKETVKTTAVKKRGRPAQEPPPSRKKLPPARPLPKSTKKPKK